jgi:hypothetical protein
MPVAVALVSDVGEILVLVVADQLVLLGLVEQQAVDGVPLLLPLLDLLEKAGELAVLPCRDLEPVPQALGDREPGHHQGRAVRIPLEAARGLVEQDAVDVRVAELRPHRDEVAVRRVLAARQASPFERHPRILTQLGRYAPFVHHERRRRASTV